MECKLSVNLSNAKDSATLQNVCISLKTHLALRLKTKPIHHHKNAHENPHMLVDPIGSMYGIFSLYTYIYRCRYINIPIPRMVWESCPMCLKTSRKHGPCAMFWTKHRWQLTSFLIWRVRILDPAIRGSLTDRYRSGNSTWSPTTSS